VFTRGATWWHTAASLAAIIEGKTKKVVAFRA
jgi:hypothetical protein